MGGRGGDGRGRNLISYRFVGRGFLPTLFQSIVQRVTGKEGGEKEL